MFRLTKTIRPIGTYSKRLFSTVEKPTVKVDDKTNLSDKDKAKAKIVIVTALGVCYYVLDGRSRYYKYVKEKQLDTHIKEREAIKQKEALEIKSIVEAIRPITKASIKKYKDDETAKYTNKVKQSLYDYDIETLAVKSAKVFDPHFYIPHIVGDTGLTKLEQCKIFKDLGPDYKNHLKETKQIDLPMAYADNFNNIDNTDFWYRKCWYEFTI